MKTEKQWDEIHREKLSPFQEKASCLMDEELERIVPILKERGVVRILDLACGAGRHTIYLAECGFKVAGIDISSAGIQIALSQLEKRGLKADLKVGSIYEVLPYDDSSFDAITCIRSINHGTIEEIWKTIKETERILRPGGIIFVTTRKRVPKRQRHPFKEIDSHTYIPLEGNEKGIIHYFFTKGSLRKEFRNFKTEIWVDRKGNYYCLLGTLKTKS